MKSIFFTLVVLLILGFWASPVKAQPCSPDVTPPNVICASNIVASLPRSGTLQVFAQDLDNGSTDNCTTEDNLVFSFDAAGTQLSENFTSEGVYDRRLYVRDEAGNQSFCDATIEIECFASPTCVTNYTVDLDFGESTDINVWDLAAGTYCPSVALSFSPTDPNDTILTVSSSDLFPLQYTIYDVNTGNSCWSVIRNCNDLPPVAIANDVINVSLDPRGRVRLATGIFDQGSYSLCGPVELFVRRLNDPGECESPDNPYRRSILFCCKDINDTVLVELMVRDERGRETSVFSKVYVENKLGTPLDCATISGTVYLDDNDNCTFDSGEDGAARVLVVATDGTEQYVTYAEGNGYYKIFAPFGTYTVYVVSPGLYWNVCPILPSVTMDNVTPDVVEDFGLTEGTLCAHMEVDLVVQRLRRCFDNVAYLDYINGGTDVAHNAYIDYILDPGLGLVQASHAYTSIGPNTYRFDLGDLAPFEGGSIQLLVHVDCGTTTIGETKCMEAHVFPDSTCLELLQWSGANVEVDARCEGDSVVFTLSNSGEGDMDVARSYEVIEDDVIMFMRSFKLNKGESMDITLPAKGATLRMNAEQEAEHPYPFVQTIAVEGCTTQPSEASLGFVTMFPLGAQEPFLDIACNELVGSYDPNEKGASPKGFAQEHYLEPGQPITYTLYFQNTGNDTAFNVYILDQLSEYLDLSTFKLGASSHAVMPVWEDGSTVRFDFPNIQLPDSNVNQLASNGFVEFTIYPKEDLPLPTRIENQVGIYFDFNAPVMTNIVYHTIDTGFVEVVTSIDWVSPALEKVNVGPNPSKGMVTWSWDNDKVIEGHIEIYNLQGQLQMKKGVVGSMVSLNLGTFSTGCYIYKLTNNGDLFASGRVILQKK